ncbi:ATP-grasp domain-containing protein [Halococcus hamelinensis]|uniref:RimK family alpha-L-glutamate ligase/30S ribosomal protein S6 modification protein n=1 Tax=Halococcus hamelinensis 100A6 TaxID=1132509 RepID=M0M409_9EURY|nr:RimK family alpha-L-glutamate ligase [Halococcus hamelinensis]EMA40148.1 RimK family alpha-L-glutamate ligase/30S ribosomal protein S6 modification protein [Halococcus hamelinensis 100A6]
MLRLAVATGKETFERMRVPLADRDIEVDQVVTEQRTIPLTDPGSEWEGFDVGFVHPSRLIEGGVADALLDVPWVNDREDILTSRNKADVLARLSRAGLPTPRSVLVSDPIDEASIVETFEAFDPPVVVKPNSTTRGTGVVKVDDLDSFLGVTDYLRLIHDDPATADRSFLVQEYLPDATDYRAMCIDGEYAGAVERRLPEPERATGRWKHNVHRGAEADGVDLPGDLRELAEQTAATLDIPWLGVDILVNDDRAVVSETNARPTIDAATKYEPGFYDDLADLIEARV